MTSIALGIGIVAVFGGYSKWAIVFGFAVALRDWLKVYKKFLKSLK